ncbi:hypothetical protein GOP47_0003420 [Adiantum capillus-veneris]|uniref:Uncharacterized protein n=1 Tax=Adiantum capillus-veneris TaxID=13818 RepID=A0A9D4ZS96_ADICA|nr:hypothetical protein GOP47_0003420 [Adiantum capillus-veneris]
MAGIAQISYVAEDVQLSGGSTSFPRVGGSLMKWWVRKYLCFLPANEMLPCRRHAPFSLSSAAPSEPSHRLDFLFGEVLNYIKKKGRPHRQERGNLGSKRGSLREESGGGK